MGQFSLLRCLAWMAVYALLLAVATVCRTPPTQLAIALGVTTLFAGVDLVLAGKRDRSATSLVHVSQWVASFSSALSLATLLVFFSFFLLPAASPSPTPLKPPPTFWELWSDPAAKAEFNRGIETVLTILAIFCGLFCGFSLLGFCASLIALPSYRRAILFLMINVPGVLLLAYFVVGAVYEASMHFHNSPPG